MNKIYALDILTGGITEVYASSIEQAIHVVYAADFFIDKRINGLSYTWYKYEDGSYSKSREYIPKSENLTRIELFFLDGKDVNGEHQFTRIPV